MNLVTVHLDSIRIGQPLPFSLRDENGVLLAHKGFVVDKREDLDLMIGRRSKLFIDVTESDSHRRAYVGQLHNLVREDRTLGHIAGTQMSASDPSREHVSALDQSRHALAFAARGRTGQPQRPADRGADRA